MNSNDIINDRWNRRQNDLPHWQFGGSTYFITFRSARGVLPGTALDSLRDHLRDGHGTQYDLDFAVLMPDHVHLLLRPREITEGAWVDLGDVMQKIKGGSARKINIALGTTGTVWQKESYDRIVRDSAEYEKHWNYMFWNPRIAGLVEDPDAYPYFVRPARDS